MKTAKYFILIFVLGLFSFQTAFSQKLWEKDWKKWNNEDCLKILTSSPWAYNYSDIDIEMFTNTINKNSPAMEAAIPKIVVRLYSSQTIQRALFRQIQISQKYDKLEENQKKEFDEKTKNFLNCEDCKKYYIVMMVQPAGRNSTTLVGKMFKDYTFDLLKDKIYLSDEKNGKRELAKFLAPKSESGYAVFFFNRFDENQKPLITNESQKLTLRIKRGDFGDSFNFLKDKIDFDVTKMIIDGNVDF